MCVVCTKQTRRIIFLYQQKIIVRLYRSFYYIQQFFEHLYDDKSKFFPKRKIALIWIPLHVSRFHLRAGCGCKNGTNRVAHRGMSERASMEILISIRKISTTTHRSPAYTRQAWIVWNCLGGNWGAFMDLLMLRGEREAIRKVVVSYQSIQWNNKEPSTVSLL